MNHNDGIVRNINGLPAYCFYAEEYCHVPHCRKCESYTEPPIPPWNEEQWREGFTRSLANRFRDPTKQTINEKYDELFVKPALVPVLLALLEMK